MYIKVLLSILIIVSSFLIGYVISLSYSLRIKFLNDISYLINLLETEIDYSNTYLPDILYKISLDSKHKSTKIFSETYNNLLSSENTSLQDAWKKSINNNYKKLPMSEKDKDILLDFGYSLGKTDKENQKKNIKYTIIKLENQLKEAENQKSKNERLYKNLGALIGIAIVIIII